MKSKALSSKEASRDPSSSIKRSGHPDQGNLGQQGTEITFPSLKLAWLLDPWDNQHHRMPGGGHPCSAPRAEHPEQWLHSQV